MKETSISWKIPLIIEGMFAGQEKHNAIVAAIARDVYAALGRDNTLVLSAGGVLFALNAPYKQENRAPSLTT